MGYTINLNDTDPVAPVGKVNVKWQKGTVPADPAQPVPVSAYVDISSGGGGLSYAVDTGSTNAYAGTFSPTPTLTAGLTLALKVANTNTGASTLSPNGLGPAAIKKLNGTTALAAGDLVAGQIYYFTYDGTNFQLVATPGILDSIALVLAVHQVGHGFTTGKAVYYNASLGWALAKADSAFTLGIGIVSLVGADDFKLFIAGYITGLSGLTAGMYYFVSDATAGLLTSTEPTATFSYSNPLLFALSTTTGVVLPFRPSVVEPFPTVVLHKSSSYSANAGDVVIGDTVGGGFAVTLPDNITNAAKQVTVKKKATATDGNTLTVDTLGGDTIDGLPTAQIVGAGVSLTFVADGAGDWQVI